MNTNTVKYPLPAQPGSGATINILTLTGQAARELRRVSFTLRSSHDSAASGLTFEVLMDNSASGTTYRAFSSYTHLAATAAVPCQPYFIAVPQGALGFKINYINSANVLTSWEGLVAAIYDEIASP